MATRYDIFISYKRKSLATANNLYYRLSTRGYSTFFDLEEMRRDNFNTQLLEYIENAKDVFVILEEGSLDGCKQDNWEEKDWFCHEIAYALERKKNIIPILLYNYQMPSEDSLPDRLKDLTLKHAPEFNFSFFDAYLDKLIKKNYILADPNIQDKTIAVFKFYTNKSCHIFMEGKLVCSLEEMSDEPYYLPVARKGDYRFKAVNTITTEAKIIKAHIDADEEMEIEIEWTYDTSTIEYHNDYHPTQISPHTKTISVLGVEFRMVIIRKGSFYMGTIFPKSDYSSITKTYTRNSHLVHLSKDYYLGETVVTQKLWYAVMQGNPSRFVNDNSPVDSVSWNDCMQFIMRLNKITGMNFRLPSEAEWEFAARGGIMSQDYLYSGSNCLNEVGWYLENSNNQTHPVKQKAPNELGLYDMSGNVWEWCQDYYDEYDSCIQCDPNGPPQGSYHVYRGGCWCETENCRVTVRKADSADFTSNGGLGLRLALTM